MNTNKIAGNAPPAANTVRICTSSDDDAWDAYVAGNPESSLYHQSAWKRVIVTSFGHESIYLMSFDPAGQCNGVLPLIHIRSWLFGNFISSLPFFNYGGLCVDDPAASDALLAYAADFGKSSGASYIEIRSTKQLDIPLPSKTNKVCMKLNLPPNAEELWARFPSKLRSQIRRAEKEGMTVRIGGIELLPAFYEVFAENMRDLGTPVYAKSFFGNIFKYFSSSARICAVFDSKQKPVAAGFLLGFRKTIEIPWASSLKEANRFS
ncbi:MAG: peptidoglycan bridge formation glycyltransferase FemA/FemB family protein, partial [Rhodocyclaceae bacterium]